MLKKYNEKHVELMGEFLTKIHPSVIKDKIPLFIQSKKILVLMDIDQLLILDEFFTINELEEARIDERLKYFGFHSKVNIFEKKAILSDLMKRRLIKIININTSLINYKKTSLNVDTEYVYSLLKHLNEYKKSFLEYTGETFYENKAEFPSRNVGKRPMFVELHNQRTFIQQLSEEVLPTTVEDNITIDILNKKKAAPSFYSIEKKDQNNGYTIYDLVDDNTVILRKKKTLYLEPSVPIDYTGDEKFEYNKISTDINDLEKDIFDTEVYKEFNPRDFVAEILFKNNNIPLPESDVTFEDLRKRIKGVKLFLGEFLKNSLKRLILQQDETLSSVDAGFIALEMKKYLTPAQVEYFYNIYIRSSDYKPVEHQVHKNIVRRRFLNKKKSKESNE